MQHLRSLLAVATLSLCTQAAVAQSAFKGKALPETVNTAYDELVPRLSPDDQVMYFVRYQHPSNQGGRAGGQDIWFSRHLPDDSWEAAQNAGAILNNQHHNFVGAVLDGGATLLLGNTYGANPEEIGPGIALSRRSGDAWSPPVTVFQDLIVPEKSRYLDFYCTPDQKVMLLSLATQGKPMAIGSEDLYVAFKSGAQNWTEPKSLGSIINTTGFETGPFLSADTKRIFFTSNGHGGQGEADIFMAERLDDTWVNWSEPVNLGPELNTAGFDGHFIMDSREEMAYFVSGPSPTALGDIYQIPVQDIPALRVEREDTLRIFALAGVPVNLQLEPYGINSRNATFVDTKPIDGPGTVQKRPGEANFVYQPAQNFQGVEHHSFVVCDPPQSDNCRKVILEATVTAPNQPTVQHYNLRTPKNIPISFNGKVDGLSLPETRRNYLRQPGPKGELLNPDVSGATFVFRPALNYIGEDSVVVYGVCPNGETSNCRVAVVHITTYEEPTAVVVSVDTPKVVEPVVVKVDTPKVVEPIVVKVDTPAAKEVVIAGIVRDEKTGNPLGAEITVSVAGKQITTVVSDPKTGAYSVTVPSGPDYALEAKQPYYFPTTEIVPTSGKAAFKGSVNRDIPMTPIPMEAGQTFTLKNIYFDLDKSTLKPESKEELTRLYELLKNYPTMEIQVKGHTDSQASDEYNQRLSDSRASAVMNYLKYKGVMGYRLSSKGFGEKVPIATNETEEGRALNRRVEFTIVKM